MRRIGIAQSIFLGCWSVLGGLTACGPEEVPPGLEATEGEKGEKEAKTQDAERIDSVNDPSNFQLQMISRYAELPSSGESLRKPFPSNWWPMSQEGIAQRWNGNNESPAEKFDRLVYPSQIREVEMTLAQKDWEGNPVNQGAQPQTFRIGPTAEWELTNHGRYGDTDPDSWWGHCNGWASYVLNEDEPIRSVSVKYVNNRVVECSAQETDCVRFDLGDINALGAEIYWHDGARMAGRRCESKAADFNFDTSGRIDNIACRDGNAASFHIVTTNMIGVLRRPFIVDLTADFQVWNYPVYQYQLTVNEEVTLARALDLIDAPSDTTTWTYNIDARRFVHVVMRASIVEDAIPPSTQPAGPRLSQYTTIETYEYILELDDAGNIIGGEWIGRNKQFHPDFVWYSFANSRYGTQDDDRADGDNPSLRYSIFKQILILAQQNQQPPPPPPPPPPPGNVLRASSSPALSIPDNNSSGVSDTIQVSESFSVASVKVFVDISHTYVGDLVVSIEHDGRSETLHNLGGGSNDNLVQEFALASWVGVRAEGPWTLRVRDAAGADVGILNMWRIELGRSSGGGGGGGGGGSTINRSYDSAPARSIPDNDQTGIRDTLQVADGILIQDVTVKIDVRHTYIADLKIVLRHGNAEQILHANTGGGADDIHQTYPTAAFRNLDARGDWTLSIVDSAGVDIGTLDSWRLSITGSSIP